jgi:hypothetical protein
LSFSVLQHEEKGLRVRSKDSAQYRGSGAGESRRGGWPCAATSGPPQSWGVHKTVRSLRQGAHDTTIKMNAALRRSINLTCIGSNFGEGGEEILKERRGRSQSWNQKPEGKGNCRGRTSPRSQAGKHEQVPSIRRP